MQAYKKDKIRNIALIGHSGEGKTSLLEAILYSTKAIDRLGKVDEGTTISDYDQEEVSRQISISLSLAYAFFKDYKINIIDVPGFFDFEGEFISALSVADAAIIVTNANGVLAVGAEKAIDYCQEKKIPAMIFVNGVNKENSDYIKSVESYTARYSNIILPIAYPVMEGNSMKGYVDVIEGKTILSNGTEAPIPANLTDSFNQSQGTLLEMAAESSDELINKFFGGETLTAEEIKTGIRARICACEVIPVIGGIAVGNVNLGGLLENIIGLLPSPEASKGTGYTDAGGAKKVMACDENGKLAVRIFKSIVDPFVGKLLLFKVIRGELKTGETVFNSNKGESEKIASMYIIRGKKQDAQDILYAGDMGALAKLNYTFTGDTLCDASDKVIFDEIEFPAPVISMAVSAAEKGAEDKVFGGLYKLMDEDATFKLEKNTETYEMLISGLGETQLDILCKKLKNKFKVVAVLTPPRIPYRETIKKKVEQQGKHKKQSGGHGQYGDVSIRFEPYHDGEFEFLDEIVGGVVPKQYIPAVEKGLRECILKGVLAGYPVHGLRAVLYFGSYHDVDSSEMSFKLAAGIAYREGLPNALPVLLEPVMKVRVIVPENYMGDIMGDLNKRRGKILGMGSVDGKTSIEAEVPQVEMAKYATDLRSITQGRGKFSMAFEKYEEVPISLSQKIIDDYKKTQIIT